MFPHWKAFAFAPQILQCPNFISRIHISKLVNFLTFSAAGLALDLVRSEAPHCLQWLCGNFDFTLSYTEVEKCCRILAFGVGHYHPHMNSLYCLINNKCPFLSNLYSDKFSLFFCWDCGNFWFLVISGVAHLKHLHSTARSSYFKSIYCKRDGAHTLTFNTKVYYQLHMKFSCFNGYSFLYLVNSYVNIYIYVFPKSLKENFTLHLRFYIAFFSIELII